MCKTLKTIIEENPNIIDIKKYYQETKIDSILQNLDQELVGLKDVKLRVREICSVLLFDKIRENKELTKLNSSLHMSFTGKAGTGKTSVAEKMALIFRNLDYLTKGHLLNVTREDLVGQYVGHTAPKTREQLQKAEGGILFIDEAYHLHKPNNERDYGAEAIELLLQVMENQREDLIIIFSGRKEKLEIFFNSNPGISSRIANHIDFPDYKTEDLKNITKFIIENNIRYKIDTTSLNIIGFYIDQLITKPTFANVRTLKIFLNQLINYQATRIEKILSSKGNLDYNSLVTIISDDLKLFSRNDFVNIIGDDMIDLFKF